MDNHITEFAQMISECDNIVFFGGAGVSTESGVKDYRSEDGLYNTVKDYGVPPEVILSRTFFFEHPDVFYDFYRKYFILEVEPNDAHRAIAYLEQCGIMKAVITQNIDGLHQKAGSTNVVELHGTAKEFYCPTCNCKNIDNAGTLNSIAIGEIPVCSKCNSVLKPRVVLYEEALHEGVAEKAVASIAGADMLIVGGTSLAVYPAASFVEYFNGKYIVMINKSATAFDHKADIVINDAIGKVFCETLKLL